MIEKLNLPFHRETVARAALQLLAEIGLDGLTTRRVAAELNIQSPSLYNHFTGKQELISCMASLMFADGFADLHPSDLTRIGPIGWLDMAVWCAGSLPPHLSRRACRALCRGVPQCLPHGGRCPRLSVPGLAVSSFFP